MGDNRQSNLSFPKWANWLLPLLVIGTLGGAVYMPLAVGWGLSAKTLNIGYQPKQPVPYSHQLHVDELGMDCLYCHNTVAKAEFAAIPATQVCINCHNPEDKVNGVAKNSEKLAKVFESYETGMPVEWIKVHDIADYAYFNHSAHINKGVGCVTCHGRVDKMGADGVYQVEELSMSWCLDCHREPEKYLRPVEEVTNMIWQAPAKPGETAEQAQLRLGRELKKKYNIHDKAYMQACSTCHR